MTKFKHSSVCEKSIRTLGTPHHRPIIFTPPFAGYGICMYAWLGKMGFCEYTNSMNINLFFSKGHWYILIWETIKLNEIEIKQ